MEIAYLCCTRQTDVHTLTKAQILDAGLYICQRKTEAKQIKAWSDKLRVAIALSESLPAKGCISSIYVIHQQNGNRYTRDGLNSAWAKAKKDAEKSTLI